MNLETAAQVGEALGGIAILLKLRLCMNYTETGNHSYSLPSICDETSICDFESCQ